MAGRLRPRLHRLHFIIWNILALSPRGRDKRIHIRCKDVGDYCTRHEYNYLVVNFNGKVLLNQRPIPGIAAINFFFLFISPHYEQ